MRKGFAVVCVSVSLSFAAATVADVARADPPATNPALAEALFHEARRLEGEGRIEEACAKYDESQRQDPTLGTLLNFALCNEKLGNFPVAWTQFNRAAAEAARTGQADRAEFARTHARDLEPKLPRLQIDVPKDSGVTDVKVDGQPLGSGGWFLPLPYDAGEHVIELSGAGRVPQTLRATVTVAHVEHVTAPTLLVSAPMAPVSLEPPASQEASAQPADTGPSSPPTLGYVALGVGAVGIGVGTVFGVLALGKKGTVDDHCHGERCDPTGIDAASATRTLATVSTVGFVVGLAAAAGGAYLVLIAPKRSTARAVVHAGAGSVMLSGQW